MSEHVLSTLSFLECWQNDRFPARNAYPCSQPIWASWWETDEDIMKIPILLTRTAFREGVFARDENRCVFCPLPAEDAHHIIERRLWPDGGYYLDNGASVCRAHHIRCETTDRKSVGVGKSGYVRVDVGGGGIMKKKK